MIQWLLNISLYTPVQIFLQNKFLKTELQKVYKKLMLLTSMLYYLLFPPTVLIHWLAEISRTYIRFFSGLPISSRPLPLPTPNTTMVLCTKECYLIISGYFPKHSPSLTHVPAPGPNSMPCLSGILPPTIPASLLLLPTSPAIRHQQGQRALIPIKVQVWRVIIWVIQAGTSDVEL